MKLLTLQTMLMEARRAATLERSSFTNVCTPGNRPATFANGDPVLENNVTDFIRERVKLHHASWIVSNIDEALEMIKRELT